MDQNGSDACEKANDEHLYCHGKVDTFGKDKVSSNRYKKVTDGKTVLEKQGCTPDQEINSCKAETPSEKNKCRNSCHVSASDCAKEDNKNNLTQHSLVVSVSRNLVAEGISGETSFSNEYASSTVVCGTPKDGEVSMQSSEGIDSTQHIPVRSNISLETGPPLSKESNELDVGRTQGNWLNSGDDGLKSIKHAAFHDTQQRTESSSSNSIHVIPPVSSETSIEAKSSKHNSSSMNDSISYGLKCCVEEPIMAAQITQKGIDNVRAMDSIKVVGMIGGQNTLIIEKVEIPKFTLPKQKGAEFMRHHKEKHSYEMNDAVGKAWKGAKKVGQNIGIYSEASGSTSSIDERNADTVHRSPVDSVHPNGNNCSGESKQGVQLCNEQGNCDSFYSNEEVVDPERPIANEHFSAMKVPLLGLDSAMMHESNVASHVQELLTTKPDFAAADNRTALLSRFDLNEDALTNEVDHPKSFISSTVSSCNVIRVVAKSGVPPCLPMTPLKFEGELGWKGSAPTSAFRPTSIFKSTERNATSSTNKNNCSLNVSQGFTGIDLNVAASEDDSVLELPRECIASAFPLEKSYVEIGSKRADMLNIDLNCLFENGDDCPRTSLPVLSTRHSMVEFDLNDNPSLGDACNDAQWPEQGSQPWGKKVLENAENCRQTNISYVRPAYWANLSSVQDLGHGHARPFLVPAPNVFQPVERMQRIVPLQPILPYTPQTLPSQSYHNPFYIGPSEPRPSITHIPGVLPYINDPHGHTAIPQILGPGLPTFLGSQHLMEVAHGRSPFDFTSTRHIIDVNSGENSQESDSRGAINFLLPAKNSSMEEQMKSFQQVSLSATPMKRREPEGGWDAYQLGYRQVTPWY